MLLSFVVLHELLRLQNVQWDACFCSPNATWELTLRTILQEDMNTITVFQKLVATHFSYCVYAPLESIFNPQMLFSVFNAISMARTTLIVAVLKFL
jgi:hypothetical protein